ncbi:hypothetical protein CCR80_06095 [Rhodothalassium salexigens]|uniref:CHASE2 domain-containing protein n=1 Tax=Rhodothalassium salexigens TaxID=1086 RepID=UPI00191140BA|nr:CHASE2 domain-containing protein [Rhodothalassium salexigens]MBK5920609.1 hypothetical protein [Rhodothalassium salexigens]
MLLHLILSCRHMTGTLNPFRLIRVLRHRFRRARTHSFQKQQKPRKKSSLVTATDRPTIKARLGTSSLKTVPFILFLALDPLGLNSFGDSMARDTFIRLAAPFFPYLSPILPWGSPRPDAQDVTNQVVVFLVQDDDIPLIPPPKRSTKRPCLDTPSRPYGISGGRPQWPVCYAEIAALLEAIQKHRPAAVFLDVTYPEKRPFRGAPDPLIQQIELGTQAGIPTLIGVSLPNSATTIRRGGAKVDLAIRTAAAAIPTPFEEMAMAVPRKHWVTTTWPISQDPYPLALTAPDATATTPPREGRFLSPAAALFRQLHERTMPLEAHARLWPGDPCLSAAAADAACAKSRQAKLAEFDRRIHYTETRQSADRGLLPDVYMTPLWPYFAQPTGILGKNRRICREDGLLRGVEKPLSQEKSHFFSFLFPRWPEWSAFSDLIANGIMINSTQRLSWVQPVHSFCYPVHVAYPRDFSEKKEEFRFPSLDMNKLLTGKTVIIAANSSFAPDEFNSPVHGRIPASFQHAIALQNLIAYNGNFFSEKKIQLSPHWPIIMFGQQGISATDVLETIIVFCAIFFIGLSVDNQSHSIKPHSPFFTSLKIVSVSVRLSLFFFFIATSVSLFLMINLKLTPFNWPAILGTAFFLAIPNKNYIKKSASFCDRAFKSRPSVRKNFLIRSTSTLILAAGLYALNAWVFYAAATLAILILERFTLWIVFGKLGLRRLRRKEAEEQ